MFGYNARGVYGWSLGLDVYWIWSGFGILALHGRRLDDSWIEVLKSGVTRKSGSVVELMAGYDYWHN